MKANAEPFRTTVRHRRYREGWWLHMEPRPEMRQALAPLSRYIATTRVSKHRLFVWLGRGTLADSATIVFARDDDYTFGVLHSRAHELWARGTGTQLREVESGFRYTPTTCFATFPFPLPSSEGREAIAVAARELARLRDGSLGAVGPGAEPVANRTLTNLYNKRPAWLVKVHGDLDKAVRAAYGWPADLDDDSILDRLLALNLTRTPA